MYLKDCYYILDWQFWLELKVIKLFLINKLNMFAVLDSTKHSKLWIRILYPILSVIIFITVHLTKTISLLSPLDFTFTFQVNYFTFTFQVKYFTFQVKIAILLFYLLLKSASSMFSTDKLVKYIWEMGPVMASIC